MPLGLIKKHTTYIEDTFKDMAYAKEFTDEGDTCFLIGDFNLDTTNGEPETYNNLIGHNFLPLLSGWGSSLKKASSATPGMQPGDYYASAYDNAFMRRNTNNIDTDTSQNGNGIDALIEECIGNNYLGQFLMDLHKAKVPSFPYTPYSNIEDAFSAFQEV